MSICEKCKMRYISLYVHTSLKFVILVGGTIRHNILYLQELLVNIVPTDDGEAKSPHTLDEWRPDKTATQFRWVLCEKRLLVAGN